MDLNWCIETILGSYLEILLFMTIPLFLHIIFLSNRNSGLPINWPVFGMLPCTLHHHIHDYLVQVFSAWGLSFMFKGPWFMGMDMLLTCDPDNVNCVFNTHNKLYSKGDDLKEMLGTFGDSMLTTEGEKWRHHRRAAHRVLGNQKFQENDLQALITKTESCLIPILERCAQENKVIDLQDVFLHLIFDTACVTFLGADPASLNYDFPEVPFAKALQTLEETIFYQHTLPKIVVKLLKIFNVGYVRRTTTTTIITDQFIAQKIEEENNPKREMNTPAYLLAPYFSCIDEGSFGEFVEHQKYLKSNLKFMLLAAIDTTTASLSWFFWLLSKHPHVEENIINELKTIANIQENSVKAVVFNKENLQKLVYLHGAICECLRLYPSVPFQHKCASQNDILPSGHKVKRGTILIFHTYSMGRMESVWGKDCLDFKPERWINQKGETRHEPAHKFFTFNCGPRICLGKDIALNKMKMVIGVVLYNFHVEMVQGHVVEPKRGMMLLMKNGLMATVRKRERF